MPLDHTTQITLAFGNTTFNVWDEGTRERVSRHADQSFAVRTILCAWADRLLLSSALVGGSINLGGTSIFGLPSKYPDNNIWVCKEVDIEIDPRWVPHLGPNGMIAYDYARLVCKYELPDWKIDSINEVREEEIDFAAHPISIDNGTAAFKWKDTGDPLPPSLIPVLHVTTISFTKERFDLVQIPTLLIASLVDFTNNTPLFGFQHGQVILRGARASRKITADGVTNFDIVYALEAHPQGWNKHYRPGTGWVDFTQNDGTLLFPEKDLSQLFR